MSRAHDEKWTAAGTDPDPNTDLDYDLRPLTVVRFEAGETRYMVLPTGEDHLQDDEFIVATAESVRDLEEWR